MDRVNLRRTIGVALILSALTFAAYWPVIHSDFIKFDDGFYVVRNGNVATGLTPGNVLWAFTTTYQGNWNPLAWISHMVDVQLFGLKPGWHHLTNLLFHTANSVLLLVLLRRLTSAFWRSAFVAALFALHPLHVESVAWISERKDVLSTFFFLLTLMAYARYARASAQRSPGEVSAAGSAKMLERASTWYATTLILFALGLMSKPMLVTVPFVLLLLDCWPLRRFDLSDGFKLQAAAPLVREKVPFLILSAIFSLTTFVAGTGHNTVYPFAQRAAIAVTTCLSYLGKTIWPANLAVFYPHPAAPYRLSDQWSAGLVLAAVLLLVAISAWAVMGWKRRPWLACGWFWYLGTLVPVIGVVQVAAHAMADRYTYIPLIGIFICVAWGAAELCSGKTPFRITAAILGTGIIAACALATHRQVQYWRNNDTLFRHALAVTGQNPFAQYHVARGLREQGREAEAIAQLQAAVAIDPTLAIAYVELGDVLESNGKTNEAIVQYEAALRATPAAGSVHKHLGLLLWKAGRQEEALAHYQEAVRREPRDADAHYNLGVACFDRGDYASAEIHLTAAARLQPRDSDVRVSLANAALRQGRLEQAEAALRDAVRINPANAQAHEDLALLLARQDHLDPAVPHFQEAVRLKPDWPDALNNLAWVEATHLRNGPEAVRLAERACELTGGREARFWGTLDTAYAAAGRKNDAIRTAEKARDMALAAGQKELAEAAAARLALYRGQPTPQGAP